MQRSIRVRGLAIFLTLISLLAIVGWQATDTKLDEASLKPMLVGLGYEVKEAGAGTYDFPMTAEGLNIPMRAFLSKGKTKLWLSVGLMQKEAVDKLTKEDFRELLEKTVSVGPSHFMIDGGMLKLKMAIDNRGITPVILRNELEFLAARVAESKSSWQKG